MMTNDANKTTNPKMTNTTEVIPPGAIMDFGGLTAPTGWLLCDGSEKNCDEFPELYEVIGTRFGGKIGETFNVPNFCRRIALGAGGSVPSGTNGPSKNVGSIGGDEHIILSESQMPMHQHKAGTLAVSSAGEHTHVLPYIKGSKSSAGGEYYEVLVKEKVSTIGHVETCGGGAHGHLVSGDTGSIGSNEKVFIMPPVLVVTKIIKA